MGGFGALLGQALKRLDHSVHVVADEDTKEEIKGDHDAGEVVLLDDVIVDEEFGDKVEEGEEEEGEEDQRLEEIRFRGILVVHLKHEVVDDHYEGDSRYESSTLLIHLIKEFSIGQNPIQSQAPQAADVGEER